MPLFAIGCRADCSGERRTSPFNGIERSLSRAVIIKTKSLPVSATTFPTALPCTSHTIGGSKSTIQRSARISTSHKLSAPRYRLPPMALQTVQVSVEPRLSTALKDRSVVPFSSPKVSARVRYHVSNMVVFLHRAETLANGYPLFKLFSKAEPVPLEKEININLVYSSCLKHANEMLLGDPRQADQRTQSFHFPSSFINHSTLLLDRALKRQAPCLVMHFEHSTAAGSKRVDASGLRAVEVIICMITRDFSVISLHFTFTFTFTYLFIQDCRKSSLELIELRSWPGWRQ